MAENILANNPLCVVDVGASGGIDPRWAKFTTSYKGILFEPDPREYDMLKSKSGKNLIVLNSALSDSSDTIDFHLCEKQQVSSTYLPNFDFLNKFPNAKRFDVTKTIKIQADTLDNQLKKNDITEIDFIKIDTQGYELPILKGSVDYLNNTIGLELEVEFAQLYENQPLFKEVDSFVQKKGFELIDLKRYYWKRKEGADTGNQKGQLVFGDALYFKSPEQVLLMKDINQEKIIRAICIYLVYGYVDLAKTLLIKANDNELLTNDVYSNTNATIIKFDRRNLVPNFRGKGRIRNLFEKIAKTLSSGGWYSGTDRSLGNP